MKKKLAIRLLLATALLFYSAGIVSAQWTDNMGGNWNNPTSASIGNIINDQLWNRIRAKARARKTGSTTSPTTSSDPGPSNRSLQSSIKTTAEIDNAVRFHPSGTQLRTQVIADELSPGGTPESKKQIFDTLSTLLTEYEKAARLKGKPNDLALAITAALVYTSSIYNGTPEPEDTTIMEIRDALAELAADGGVFASMTDRQKQELYETAVISTMLAKVGYEEAKKAGDQNSMTVYRNLAGQTLQALSGMPPEKVNFNIRSLPAGEIGPTSSPLQENNLIGTIAATTLVMEYERNEVRATQMYGGKRIRVNGVINKIEVQKGGRIDLIFVSPAASPTKTRCHFDKSQSSILAELKGGQEVTAEGIVRGYGDYGKFYVVMEDCRIR